MKRNLARMRSLGLLDAVADLNAPKQRTAKRVKVDAVTVPARTKRPRKAKDAATEKMARKEAEEEEEEETETEEKEEKEEKAEEEKKKKAEEKEKKAEEEKKKKAEEKKKKAEEEKKKKAEEKKKKAEEKKKKKAEEKKKKKAEEKEKKAEEEKKKKAEEKKKKAAARKAALQQARKEAAKEFATKAKEAAETAKGVGTKVTAIQIKTLFYLQSTAAAAVLGICRKTLWMRHRELGLTQWPWRRLYSMEVLMALVAADESRGDERQAILEKLREEKELIQQGQQRKWSPFANSLRIAYYNFLCRN